MHVLIDGHKNEVLVEEVNIACPAAGAGAHPEWRSLWCGESDGRIRSHEVLAWAGARRALVCTGLEPRAPLHRLVACPHLIPMTKLQLRAAHAVQQPLVEEGVKNMAAVGVVLLEHNALDVLQLKVDEGVIEIILHNTTRAHR